MSFESREDKEKRVRELLAQRKSTRDIAKEVQMSFKDIGFIRRRMMGEADAGSKEREEEKLSIDNKVLKMFNEGKSPLDVTIELNLKPDFVTRLYKDWFDLRGLGLLNQIHEELNGDIIPLNELHQQLKFEQLSPKKVITAARYMDQLPLLESKYTTMQNEVQNLETQIQYLKEELIRLRYEKVDVEEESNTLIGLINGYKQEISNLIYEIQRLESLISRLKDNGEYQIVQAIAERQVRDLLSQNGQILVAALWGVVKALALQPNLKQFIVGSFGFPIYDPGSGFPPQNYMQYLQAEVLKIAEEVQSDLLAKCLNNTMSSTLDTITRRPSFFSKRQR